MANPHKGDVALSVGDKVYTLRYSHSALVKLEKLLDKGMVQIMEDLQKTEDMRLSNVVALLWAGLQKHHPSMTEEDAADLLDDIDGGASGAINVIGEAFERAFSAPGTKGTNPPQKVEGNGTGMLSSSTTSLSDMTKTASGR